MCGLSLLHVKSKGSQWCLPTCDKSLRPISQPRRTAPPPRDSGCAPGGDCRGRAGAADSPLPGVGRARAQPGTPRHVTAWAGTPRETGRPGMGGGRRKKQRMVGKVGTRSGTGSVGTDLSKPRHRAAGPRLGYGPRPGSPISLHPPTHPPSGAEDWPVLESPACDPWPRGSGFKLQLPQAVASRTDPWGGPTISCSSLSREQWPAFALSP